MENRLVIVGAGQSGFAVAAKLRAQGDTRPITIIGSESVPPYQRPPLSKKYLVGDVAFETLLFRHEDWFRDNHIDLCLGSSVEEIDRREKCIVLQNGSRIAYDSLVLTTGASPRSLPSAVGGDLQGVYLVRDKRDCDLLRAEMRPERSVLIIGGGYVGLEAAAVARSLGLRVILVELGTRILQRVAASDTSDIVRAAHVAKGVEFRENTGLVTLISDQGHVTGAELSDGSKISADFVIIGIGVVPNDQLARASGLSVGNGISVDEYGCTSDPSIYAAGDCTEFSYKGRSVRLESVQNAVDQAETVATSIMGGRVRYEPQPWFWSDQFDLKLQIAGYNVGYDRTLVRNGSRPGAKSVWYFQQGQFIAVDAINDPKAFVSGRRMLSLGINPPAAVLEDEGLDLVAYIRSITASAA
ncbi:Ferredoxin--NAD(P)(+) reductase fdr [Ensifer adhaerens]|uniref:FAD-dependent oxidoreductase n=1 Tax=Ensifer adhaerens TaxID=106592 RepID=UPI00156895A3|nr:Ferredoxin--NAD(P)(+) reductase fdr [Ensifer adhaerens]